MAKTSFPFSSQRLCIFSDFAQQLADRYGLAADAAIHQPHRHGDERNWHAHILLSCRRLTKDGFGEKARELDDQKQGPMEVERIRADWAQVANHALERAELSERIDHRSLRAQGVERMPSVHLGPAVSAMERRGLATRQGNKNREAQTFNAQLVSVERERREREAAERQAREEAEKARHEAERASREAAERQAVPTSAGIDQARASFAAWQAREAEKKRQLEAEQAREQERQAKLEAERKAQEQQRREQERALSRSRGPSMGR